MKKTIFGVFDRKVKEFVIIRDCVNIEDFKRWFTLALMDVPSIFSRFPEDYDIYTLAFFDSETGALTTGDLPASLVCSVSELKVVPLNAGWKSEIVFERTNFKAFIRRRCSLRYKVIGTSARKILLTIKLFPMAP